MRSKIIIECTVAFAITLILQNRAYSIPTKWERIDVSFSELLDSGWQLIGTSTNRVAYRNSIGPGGLDEETYAFSLTKNGKYILCEMSNPSHPIAKNAGCRRLN
jgi:hypothetical protein